MTAGERPRVAEEGKGTARLVLVTGLSGSGKSTAAKSFEDLGYYLVDNLPLALMEAFLRDPREYAGGRENIAVVADVRSPGFTAAFPRLLDEIDADVRRIVVFFEASDDVLLRRFSETRRPHPLAADRPLLEGIQGEREMLTEVRARADVVIDTSDLSVHELKGRIFREFADRSGAPKMIVSLISFGFKHGIPKGTDLLFDVRFLPNPYFVPELRNHTGRDASVRDFLEEHEEFGQLAAKLEDYLLFVLPRHRRDNRSYLTVAIGCTGGHHRSVAMAEKIRAHLREEGWSVQLTHRDLERE